MSDVPVAIAIEYVVAWQGAIGQMTEYAINGDIQGRNSKYRVQMMGLVHRALRGDLFEMAAFMQVMNDSIDSYPVDVVRAYHDLVMVLTDSLARLADETERLETLQ